jgi:hypothetical protein
MVQCAHGVLPVPAPATAELITGKPAYSTGVEGELLTPTGAALLTTLAAELGPMPAMTVRRVGYGAGALEPRIPNLLRIILGEAERGSPDHLMERVGVLETNIDDMNPQLYDHVIQKALAEGAWDVFLTPVHMKKNRPAALLSLICPPERLHDFADLILRETTSLGLRWRVDNRIKLRRAVRGMETPYGLVRFKIAGTGKEVVNAAPEYEDCRRLALEKGVPLKKVFEAAQRVALKLEEEGSESWDD